MEPGRAVLRVAGFILTCLLASGVPANGMPARAGPVPKKAVDKSTAEVRTLVQERFRASYAKSVSQIAPLYADDPQLLVYRDGEVIRGWTSYRNYWEASLKNLPKDFRVEFYDTEIHVSSHQAWAASEWRVTYTNDKGKSVARKGLMTMIFDDHGSGWHIVYEHISTDIH